MGPDNATSRRVRFTVRQSQIVEMAARDISDKEIARLLGISRGTVRTHLARLYTTQGLHSKAAAVAAWLTAGDY